MVLLFLCFSDKGKDERQTMETMMKDWFDAVVNGNIELMQQLIGDEIPVDILNEVSLGTLQFCGFQFISVVF